MNKQDFLTQIKSDISSLLEDKTLSNFKNQAFAWKLTATFARTFQEKYLFEKALFLSTNGCFFIQNQYEIKIALEGLTESAEIYSTLSELPNISNYYDKEYLQILSALCYDLAGYQANAYCIANRIKEFKLSTMDSSISLNSDNAIFDQIILILLKKIPLANISLDRNPDPIDKGYLLFQNAVSTWYSFLLNQEEGDYQKYLRDTYLFYLNSGNTYISHVLHLLNTRILLFEERSIWKTLSMKKSFFGNLQWKKYTRLLSYDMYENSSIKGINERKSIFEFWTSQIRALENGILDRDENFVVQMPTSAGKTFIAELLILKNLIENPNKKCIYIAPFRALTHEKEIELSKNLSKLGYSVSSLSGNYEMDEFQNIILAETDLLIATPEKIDLLLRHNLLLFNNVSLVVIDEGHIIGEISTRASLLEFLIIRLKIKTPEIKLFFISAVMPPLNANEYSLWLSNNEKNVLRSLKFNDSPIEDEWEPTRKLISSFRWEGNRGNILFQNVTTGDGNDKNSKGAVLYSYLKEKEFGNRYPRKKNKFETAASLAFKMSEDGNTLVFCAQVQRIKTVAKSLKALFSVIEVPKRFLYFNQKKSSFYASLWYGNESYITEAIDHGIGIHFGDMPEQVRNAVEEDFRKGLLSILLSTNTIGQGLNFPIKNIIFYETQISRVEKQNIYIQNRDFWNIIGRAGRAGKETEGKIVFLINSRNDATLYKGFTNKNNIENANSLFFQALDFLTDKRIKEDNFFEIISTLSETYLLDLLTEEIIGTDYEDIIDKIINNSLFKIQIEKKNLDISLIRKGFQKTFNSIEVESSFELLKIFSQTGLSFRSNNIICEYIEIHILELNVLIEKDDYFGLLKEFLEFISENSLTEINESKLHKITKKPIELELVIQEWINGKSILELINIWEEKSSLEITQFHIFISQALNYLYPWILSSFLQILAFKAGIKYQNLPSNIKTLPNYIKFGLNDNIACLARSLGIKSRHVVTDLSRKSSIINENDFIKWITNLTYNEIDAFEIAEYDKENIQEIAIKLTTNRYSIFPEVYEFFIKGTNFNNNWSTTARGVAVGNELTYKREEDNKYDPFAILILKDENIIGYIPREFSKKIASEIDINGKLFSILVIAAINKEENSEIKVRMSAIA